MCLLYSCVQFLAGCFWPLLWSVLIECGYFSILFYWLYLCKTDLLKLQKFARQMSGSAAMFSSFVIRFRLQHIY